MIEAITHMREDAENEFKLIFDEAQVL